MLEEEIQKQYYEATASGYECMRGHEWEIQDLCLRFINSLLSINKLSSFLEIGSGTGRATKFLLDKYPDTKIYGIEPVQSLIRQATLVNKLPCKHFICSTGLSLPFRDSCIDVVYEFAVLHHVRNPNDIVREMMRVAKKAIFIADSNRFGQGRVLVRCLKLMLYKIGLWKFVNYIKTKGKGYTISEGDGLSYSYSVYDSYDALAKWADRIILIPIYDQKGIRGIPKIFNWATPLLTSPGMLLCALKE